MNKQGLKIILSGPSGSGKGTIVRKLINNENMVLSISATTRAPREGEKEGVHYFYRTKEEFEQMIKENALLEYAEFCGNYYGTPKAFIEETTSNGKDVILEIEVQGALQIKEIYPDAVFIFIIPPTLIDLKNRLIRRGTEDMDTIEKRLQRAGEELVYYKEYDYVVVNESVEDATETIKNIIEAEHHKVCYYNDFIKNIIEER